MSYKVIAHIADGALISQHPEDEVQSILGRSLKWEEEDGRVSAGRFYQTNWVANITTKEASKLLAAGIDHISIKKGNSKYVYPVWMTY